MTDDRLYRHALMATGLVALAIVVLTLWPKDNGEAVPWAALHGSRRAMLSLFYHFVAYTVLVWPLTAIRPRSALWLVPVAAAAGAVMEAIQPHVGRNGTVEDALANALGACMGAALGWLTHRYLRRRRALR